ncbi:hypothetical protein HK101_009723 [Irineochytrium annulatum]|nr:hypothetical protein HK101_009723 [Irineochytrium annulatum]
MSIVFPGYTYVGFNSINNPTNITPLPIFGTCDDTSHNLCYEDSNSQAQRICDSTTNCKGMICQSPGQIPPSEGCWLYADGYNLYEGVNAGQSKQQLYVKNGYVLSFPLGMTDGGSLIPAPGTVPATTREFGNSSATETTTISTSTAASNGSTSTAAFTSAAKPPVALIAGMATAAVIFLGIFLVGVILFLHRRRANQRKAAASNAPLEVESAPHVLPPPVASAPWQAPAPVPDVVEVTNNIAPAAEFLATRTGSTSKVGLLESLAGSPSVADEDKLTLAENVKHPIPPPRIVSAVVGSGSAGSSSSKVETTTVTTTDATAIAGVVSTGNGVSRRPSRESRDVIHWTADDVAAWLNEIQYNAAVAQAVRVNGIDGARLLTLPDETMKGTLGLTTAGAREVFRSLVRGLQDGGGGGGGRRGLTSGASRSRPSLADNDELPPPPYQPGV